MEGLKYLCICCKNSNCTKQQIIIKEIDGCTTIKCLEFQKDIDKIKKK